MPRTFTAPAVDSGLTSRADNGGLSGSNANAAIPGEPWILGVVRTSAIVSRSRGTQCPFHISMCEIVLTMILMSMRSDMFSI